jgi:murein DD-endopeptidase MepM/ murein hydrolase activator NlpD
MPHRLDVQYHSDDYDEPLPDARLQPAAAAAEPRRADYTLVHAGRQLRLGPIAFWVVVGTLVIMAVWTITTATYFAFRDDVLTRLIARQAEMQFGYEDRIAELRAQVDRMSSRQLLDQDQYEQKLDQMLRRQAALESRAAALSGLPDSTITGSIRPPARNEPARPGPFKPSPINDSGAMVAPLDRQARLAPAARSAGKTASGNIDTVLVRLQASLDRVEARQSAALNSIEGSYDAKARKIHGVLTEVGVDAGKLAARGTAGGTGGPFIAATRPAPDAGAFERQIYRISVARAQVDRLTRTLGAVPVRKPVMGELDLSSGFGVRMDPFIRAPAMHTGLDFRGDIGDPVRVTANGTVTTAGWSGGYGKMVEVSHGNGFATRYGHMSSIDVRVGQAVKIGQIIGRLGSTGRSTGPHLHYETRVEGEAVDPLKFLRAGSRLSGAF